MGMCSGLSYRSEKDISMSSFACINQTGSLLTFGCSAALNKSKCQAHKLQNS